MTKTIRTLFLSGAASAALAACAGFEAPTPNFPIDVNDYRPAPTAAQVQAAAQAQTPAPPVQDGPRAVPSSRIASAELAPPPGAAPAVQAAAPTPTPTPAPVQPKPVAPAAASWDDTVIYVIQPGDTLSGVARRFGTPLKALVELNALGPEGAVKAGQKVKVPASAVDKGTDPYATGPAPARLAAAPKSVRVAETEQGSAPAPVTPKPQPQAPASKPQPATPAPTASVPPPKPVAPMVSSTPQPGDAEIVRLGRGKFVWPVTGEILSRFGAFGQGLKNDGLNIGAPAGTPVKSAAAGEVVYAGNSVPGFGNLVLVKHADGWVSAYGHLAGMSVKMKDRVAQGQEIGQVGQTGGVDRPQVHFELRYAPTVRDRAKPVDPALVLP